MRLAVLQVKDELGRIGGVLPRLAVVFDSNVYRHLGRQAFAALRDLEIAHSVLGFASHFVVREYLSHLADPSDPSFRPSLASLKRLWEHCHQYDGSREVLRFVADSEEQVAASLFGAEPQERDIAAEHYGALAGELTHSDPHTWAPYLPDLRAVREYILISETQWVDALWRTAVLGINASAASWHDVTARTPLREEVVNRIRTGLGRGFVARAIASRAATAAAHVATPEQIDAAASKVVEMFAPSVYLYDRLVQKVIVNGEDMSRYPNPNSLWDYQISFSTGRGALVWGVPLILVSNDEDMLASGLESGHGHRIMSFPAYLSLLSQPSDDLWPLLDAYAP
jgi:hypothetical protein